ncbi:hypothetical protein [Vibrio anguillarum]|uniref:hypothetical protein n=2 Tax=Vibrio anguillarum TaxID=55601 RepID=UPI000BB4BCE3|nr:hypothetical protein [Vibrio anguillarum]ATC60286.1 hypothetical protein CMV05_23130 [Vibrio anguillarum]MBF4249499.1 hypothetical protein [Vibrio anguillarum]MBF4340727.1 hypothetical protein [Vibrio anguillarum]
MANKIDFENLPYTVASKGIDTCEDYIELEIEGDDFLILFCQFGTVGGTKALRYHYGVHNPAMGSNRWLSFDVRELFKEGDFSYPEFPNKGADRLKIVAAMIDTKFASGSELLAEIVNTKSQPIQI